MTQPPQSPAKPAGLAVTLRAAVNAGLMNGLLFGLADGIVAGRSSAPGGLGAWLGCLALAVLSYGVVWVCVLVPLGLLGHRWMRAQGLYGRFGVLLSLGVGLGLFLESYWWSRPYVFSGLSALDPRRLAFAGLLLVLCLGAAFLLRRGSRFLPGALRMAATVVVPVCWIGGAAYLFSLRGETEGRGELNPRNRERPNVLLIVCDALRADKLGAYGNTRIQTPVMDDLARRGVLFERATVTAPFTWASFGSLLTGKYPRRHGLVKMDPTVRMRRENVTLPLHLKSANLRGGGALEDQDFASATFMTGTLSHGSGLARGFDVYYEALVGHDLVDTASPWSEFRSQLVLSILRDKLAQTFDSSRVVSVARDWFESIRGRRFVAMVHLYSTHTPYDPPQRFRDQYCDPAYTGPVRAFYAEHRIMIEDGKVVPTEADKRQIRDLYDAGVAEADEMIGELLDTLRAQGALDDTLVILTADHGEELGEHGLWEHDWHFQSNLEVPLIMAWPPGLPADKRVAPGVQLIDVLPTICELLELELPADAAGADPEGHIDGTSLVALARGAAGSVRAFAFAENENFLAVQDTAAEGPRFKLVVAAGVECAKALELRADSVFPLLYRLDLDPGETRSVLQEYPAEAQRLLEALCQWDASMPIPQSDVIASDRDVRNWQMLFEQLGYAGSNETR